MPTIGLSMILLLFFSEVSHATICYCVFRDVIEDTVTIKNIVVSMVICVKNVGTIARCKIPAINVDAPAA